MAAITFGQTVGMLKNALTGASESHDAISNNIANVQTPDFHRTDVTFKEALAASDPTTGDPEELSVVTNDPRQIPIGTTTGETFSVTSTVDDSQQMRPDGSNVDVDQEMAKLSINSSYAQTMSQMLTNSYTRIKQAILEHAS
jgi:flagellar basal-body rod protein FlgB